MTRAAAFACWLALALAPGTGAAQAVTDDYRIGPADVLRITVWKEEELNSTVHVRPDGMISLPLLNDVRAEGLTPLELKDVLTEQLSRYVTAPVVSVIVEEVHSFTVSVLGEVREPGRYQLRSNATVLDMIAEAGGFTEFASPSRVVILRNNGETTEKIRFNYNGVVSRVARQENITVRRGDVIVVP